MLINTEKSQLDYYVDFIVDGVKNHTQEIVDGSGGNFPRRVGFVESQPSKKEVYNYLFQQVIEKMMKLEDEGNQ